MYRTRCCVTHANCQRSARAVEEQAREARVSGLEVNIGRASRDVQSADCGTAETAAGAPGGLVGVVLPGPGVILKPQLQDQNRVLYPGLDHLQVSRTVFSTITPDIDRIPGAIAPFDDKAPNCRSETNPATPPGLFAAREKIPQAILPNAPPQGDKVGGRRFFSRQDAAENGQD